MVDLPDPLNLPGVRATEQIETETQITYLGRVKSPKPERRCKCLFNDFVLHTPKDQSFRDLPIRRKFVDIHIKRQRFRCKQCGAVVQTVVPGMVAVDAEGGTKHRMTERLADDVFRQSFKRTFSDVAREVGLTEGTIRNVFNDRIEATLKAQRWQTPRVLGIDEKKLMGDYRCVLGDVEDKCLIDLLSNRRKHNLHEYVKAMENKERVEIVCMDMWPTYREIVRTHFPKAQIVTDKFHVVRMANDAMEVIRKEIRRTLPKERRIKMKNERYTLLKRRKSWEEKDYERYEQWEVEFHELVRVFDIKEGFYEIFDHSQSAAEARRLYLEWDTRLPDDYRRIFRPITTAMRNWGDSAFMCCEPGFRFTNAYVESLNGFIGSLSHAGRGYSFDVLRGKALMAYGRHKEAERKFKRIKPDDLIEIDGEMVPRNRIRVSLGPPPKPERRPNGIPLSTLAALIADGALTPGSPLFYE